eukprot:Gb_24615 [translate_table: standard]
MESVSFGLVLLFSILLLGKLPAQTLANDEGCVLLILDALIAFKNAVTDNGNTLGTWDPNLVDPCTWFHVTCNSDNSVTRLDLGSLMLSGGLVPQFSQLKNLQYLELYENNLNGVIPTSWGGLNKLVSLDLYSNNLTGIIPDSFGQLSSLRFLRLNNNRLSGGIPGSLTAISSLVALDLSYNDLSGPIPTTGSFAKFTRARQVTSDV